jgi:hypothetical protein
VASSALSLNQRNGAGLFMAGMWSAAVLYVHRHSVTG